MIGHYVFNGVALCGAKGNAPGGRCEQINRERCRVELAKINAAGAKKSDAEWKWVSAAIARKFALKYGGRRAP